MTGTLGLLGRLGNPINHLAWPCWLFNLQPCTTSHRAPGRCTRGERCEVARGARLEARCHVVDRTGPTVLTSSTSLVRVQDDTLFITKLHYRCSSTCIRFCDDPSQDLAARSQPSLASRCRQSIRQLRCALPGQRACSEVASPASPWKYVLVEQNIALRRAPFSTDCM
eukprot:COSAG02_NODE_14578_length_1258_cov_1.207075_2_plen_168_part_00